MMKNYEIIGNIAFYDSIKENDLLTSVARAKKWSIEAHKNGINSLYIKALGNTSYKIEYGENLVPIRTEHYDSEYQKNKCACKLELNKDIADNNKISTIDIANDQIADNEVKLNLLKNESFDQINYKILDVHIEKKVKDILSGELSKLVYNMNLK